MSKIYKSEAFRAIHEGAVAMYEVGAISEERMREYDRACLKPEARRVSLAADKVSRVSANPIG
jgi:DNA-binding transcriptional regulator YiaG